MTKKKDLNNFTGQIQIINLTFQPYKHCLKKNGKKIDLFSFEKKKKIITFLYLSQDLKFELNVRKLNIWP